MTEHDWENFSEKEEIFALVGDLNHLIQRLAGDFVNYHTGKGYIEMNKESPKFVVIMRVERKKEAK